MVMMMSQSRNEVSGGLALAFTLLVWDLALGVEEGFPGFICSRRVVFFQPLPLQVVSNIVIAINFPFLYFITFALFISALWGCHSVDPVCLLVCLDRFQHSKRFGNCNTIICIFFYSYSRGRQVFLHRRQAGVVFCSGIDCGNFLSKHSNL